MANTKHSKSTGLISSEYTNPIDAMTFKIFNIFEVFRVNSALNSNGESTQIVLLLVSLYKDGLISNEIISEDFSVTSLRNAISESNLDEKSKLTYLSVIDVLYDSLYKVINNSLNYLGFYLFQIEKELLIEYFPAIFDDVIYRIAQSHGRYSSEFIQPVELTRFMCRLVDMKTDVKVFNPFAGIASFGINLRDDQTYIGQEINQNTWVIGTLRLMAYTKLTNSKYEKADSIEEWPNDSQRFDLIISNPPLGMRINMRDPATNSNTNTAEHFLLEKGIQSLRIHGMLIAVLSQGILFKGGRDLELRKHLIENNLIDAIISFPGGLFNYTAIPFVVMVLSNQHKSDNKIRFIKADNYIVEKNRREKVLHDELLYKVYASDLDFNDDIRIVNREVLRSNDYNLNVNRYFYTSKDKTGIPEGAKLIKLGDLVETYKSELTDSQTGKVVNIADLSESINNFEKIVSDFEIGNTSASFQKIESSVLLLSKIRTLKPTFCKVAASESIYCNSNIVPLSVDETKVYIPYLILELNSERVNRFVKSRLTGISIPTLSKKDILEIPILLYSLEEQKAKFAGYIEATVSKKKEELISFSKIHGLEKEMFEQNTHLRHTLAGPTSNLVSSLAHIKSIIIDKIAPIHPEILGQKFSEEHLFTLVDYLDIVERDALKIFETVKRQLKADDIFDSKLLSPIDFVDFLKVYFAEKAENNDLDFIIDLGFDKKSFWDDITESEIKTVILANEDLLTDMFNNLIENAVKHAFSAGNKNRIEVYVMKDNITESNPEIQILFSNTGRPFPEDYGFDDYIRKGSKAGSNAGDGYGGWYVNEIIKYHKGSFDFIDETGSEGLPGTDLVTSFEINFPIIEMDE